MRTLMIAGAVIALAAANGASAQVTVHRGNPSAGLHTVGQHRMGGHGNRWGSKVGGRWWGGSNAPGGWQAYRRPARGYALPRYWVAPRFYITDWADYGLDRPLPGYNWARYYDDAVMIDSRGSVYDTVDGVDWDDDDTGPGGYDRDDGPPPPPPGNGYGAGYAPPPGPGFDGDRPPPPPPHGRGPDYPPPPPPGGPNGYHGGGGDRWVSPDGLTTVTTSGGYGSTHYYAGGYGGSTTTVTVQSAPVVTTTTETTYEDVSYSRPHKVWHKKWHAKVWRARPRCACK